MQNRQWDSTVFNGAEELGNWDNQIESEQPFLFHPLAAQVIMTGNNYYTDINS